MACAVELEPVSLGDLPDTNPLLQTGFWGEFKEQFGWRAMAFRIHTSGCGDAGGNPGEGATVLCLLRTFALGFTLVYIPHGPVPGGESGRDSGALAGDAGGRDVGDTDASGFLHALSRAIVVAVGIRVDLVRFDLFLPADKLFSADASLLPAPAPVQPPDTVIVNIAQSEDEILRQMKSKTRYNVRLAKRRGVAVRVTGVTELDLWYSLYQITAQRDGIVIHTKEYYRTLFLLSQKHSEVQVLLLLAEVNGDVVAGNIVALCGDTGYYLFGASSNMHRNLMPTYLLQWEGMRLCRSAGCTKYDLWGIPPSNDPKHPMYGLYRMKTGFGGEVVTRGGARDFLARPLRARAYRVAEKIRTYYFKRLR